MTTLEKWPTLILLVLHPSGCDDCDENYDPYGVFKQLFDFMGLDDIRKDLWEMYKLASRNPELDEYVNKRDRFLFTYEILHDILTAAYFVLRNKEEKEQSLPTN